MTQAAIAFLKRDVLGQADMGRQRLLGQYGPRNPNMTVRELLDRASKGIEGRFKDQPLMEAEIRMAIGDTYRGVEQLDKAQLHLERALALLRDRLGEAHYETLGCENDLAVLYHARANAGRVVADYGRAEALLRDVLGLREKLLGPSHQETLAT
jgi:hypothetical protein